MYHDIYVFIFHVSAKASQFDNDCWTEWDLHQRPVTYHPDADAFTNCAIRPMMKKSNIVIVLFIYLFIYLLIYLFIFSAKQSNSGQLCKRKNQTSRNNMVLSIQSWIKTK